MATTSAAKIYGRIGAAKVFSSGVSHSLGLDIEKNNKTIAELEGQLSENENDKKLAKKIKRLKRQNQFQTSSQKVADSTTSFLIKLASYMDMSIETVINFIANLLVSELPAIELSLKMLLLTNIKKMVSCAVDPTIPDEWRNGVWLNEAEIDPRNILKTSPFSKWGKYLYFGCYDTDKDTKNIIPKEVYSLARADDMNAFLWFVKNKGKFVSSNIPSSGCTEFFDVDSGTTFYNTSIFKEKSGYQYTPGSTFKQSANANTIFLCENKIKTEGENNNSQIEYTILPVSDTWTGVNWYKPSNFVLTQKINSRSKVVEPLFNIEYINTYTNATTASTPQYRDGNFKFRILPKPFTTAGGFVMDLYNNVNTLSDIAMAGGNSIELIGDELSGLTTNEYNYQFTGIQSPIPYTARFNGDGEYDKKGKYSIDTRKYNVVKDDERSTSAVTYYDIYTYNTTGNKLGTLTFKKEDKTFSVSGNSEGNSEGVYPLLTECYFGKTVYEFNYDYVMGMQLLDPQSIAIGIVDLLMNINFPTKKVDDDTDYDTLQDTDQIKINTYANQIVEKMIQSEDTEEFTDCFYNFSNSDYEQMEQEVADKIARNISIANGDDSDITAIYDIINAYDANATLEERLEVITRVLTKTADACGFTDSADISEQQQSGGTFGRHGTEDEKRDLIEQYIKKAITYLITSIVQAILTPKLIMLIQVNKRMMGSDAFSDRANINKKGIDDNIDEILNSISGILKSMIRQVIDVIQKELLRVILERLSEVMAGYIRNLGTEYAMKWVLLLKELLKCFKRNKSKINNNNYDRLGNSQYTDVINNILDQVDYADIDALVDEMIPNTNPC